MWSLLKKIQKKKIQTPGFIEKKIRKFELLTQEEKKKTLHML